MGTVCLCSLSICPLFSFILLFLLPSCKAVQRGNLGNSVNTHLFKCSVKAIPISKVCFPNLPVVMTRLVLVVYVQCALLYV